MSNKFKSVKKEYWSMRRKNIKKRFARKPSKNNAPNLLTMTERIAFVIDGEVVDVIGTQPKFAAILLSEPLIIDVSNKEVMVGYKYENGEFIAPVHEHNQDHNGEAK